MTKMQTETELDRTMSIFYSLVDDRSVPYEKKQPMLDEMNKQISELISKLEDKYQV